MFLRFRAKKSAINFKWAEDLWEAVVLMGPLRPLLLTTPYCRSFLNLGTPFQNPPSRILLLFKIRALLFTLWRLLGAAVGQPGRVIELPHGHPQKPPEIKKERPDFKKE